MSKTRIQRSNQRPRAAVEAGSKSPFWEDEEGCVVVDGVVHLTVDGVRDMSAGLVG